ncbi:MAC/perforin family protein [Chlamydia abortus]|uniref:MAC/perforin family protein n=1 Tax=Chlamydia abortus TaxID=83555 RepID=UPI0011EF278F|nr:MAC/perforin family protein [Chlamydia abortus]QEM73904.1 MAC/perforin family protein [Chlamydia abortus]
MGNYFLRREVLTVPYPDKVEPSLFCVSGLPPFGGGFSRFSPSSPTCSHFSEEVSKSKSKEISVERRQLFSSYTPKLKDVVKVYKRDAKVLINKMSYCNIWRSLAKSQILTERDVRLDLQGIDKGMFNYQIQVGPYTVAAVLIDQEVSEIKIPSEQVYAIRKIKSGFQQSLSSQHVYRVGFKSSVLECSSGSTTDEDEEFITSNKIIFKALGFSIPPGSQPTPLNC